MELWLPGHGHGQSRAPQRRSQGNWTLGQFRPPLDQGLMHANEGNAGLARRSCATRLAGARQRSAGSWRAAEGCEANKSFIQVSRIRPNPGEDGLHYLTFRYLGLEA